MLEPSMGPEILSEFRQIIGRDGVICEADQLRTYECDALTNFRVVPKAVLLPSTTEQVQAILRLCHRERIPFVARGSGTGLSGGALPVDNGIVISLARMNGDRKSTRLNSSHGYISYAVFCLKKKKRI